MFTNPLSDLPMGFGMALMQNPDALHFFAGLNDEQKKAVINKIQGISSKNEMQQFVQLLGQNSFLG